MGIKESVSLYPPGGSYMYMCNIMRSFKKGLLVQKTGDLCLSALISGLQKFLATD